MTPQKPVVNRGEITTFIRITTAQLPIYFRPFIGGGTHNSICNEHRGPPVRFGALLVGLNMYLFGTLPVTWAKKTLKKITPKGLLGLKDV